MTMVVGGNEAEVHTSGEIEAPAMPGGLVCVECGYALSLLADDTLPHCPACGGRSFRRAAMFEQTTVGVDAIDVAAAEPAAVSAARERLAGAGPHLAWEADGRARDLQAGAGLVEDRPFQHGRHPA